jgi:hypothetical protein
MRMATEDSAERIRVFELFDLMNVRFNPWTVFFLQWNIRHMGHFS